MKKFVFLAVATLTLVCCKKDPLSVSDMLVNNRDGWVMQYYTVYDGRIENEYTDVYKHYKNVGSFKFEKDFTGVYKYDGTETPFVWSVMTGAEGVNYIEFVIDEEDVTDYNSPFLYCYFSGQTATPFTSYEGNRIKSYEINVLNDFTVQCRFNPGGESSEDLFGGIEFILCEVQ